MANIKNPKGIRRCYICNWNYPATNEFFCKDKNRPLNLSYQCKPCARIRSAKREKHRNRTPEQKAQQLKRSKEHRERKGWYWNKIVCYKIFDDKKGFEFDLTVEWFEQNILNKSCIYCQRSNVRMGCDRVDNSKGHLKSNVVPSCKECNITRGNTFTHEEMIELGKIIKIIFNNRTKP